jgi:TonB family protein
MFAGHFAVALAAKRAAPKTSLGTLVFAAQFLDLIWPVLVLLGVEWFHIAPGVTKLNPLAFDHYPVSHSLVMSLVWSLLVGAVYFWRRRSCRGAGVLGAAVFSHWVLDWITHAPDLQLAPGAASRVGLGLWNHPAAAIAVEGGLFVAAVASYATQTHARDAVGRWSFFAFVFALALIQFANTTGPPPPSAQAVAWSALIIWLFVPWSAWFDRHRVPRQPSPATMGSRAATGSAAGLILLGVCLTIPMASRAEQLPAGLPEPPRMRLADPQLFLVLATAQANAGWLDSTRVDSCAERERHEGAVGCQPFVSGSKPLGYTALGRLADILPRCTWVRDPVSAPVRPVLDWGASFRGPRISVDLGVALDSMTLLLFSPGERNVRGIVPQELKADLATIAARSETSTLRSIACRQRLIRRWGESVETASLGPCDGEAAAGDGEFVYFEDPPAPVTAPPPARPAGAAPGTVILHVLVNRAGRVCDVKVKRGDPILAAAAAQAVREWVFKPAMSQNKPVAVWVEVPVKFP